MQQLADLLRRHSRKKFSHQKRISPTHKGSDYSLRKRTYGKSNPKLQLSIVQRHHRSINLNNISAASLKKDRGVDSLFLKGKSLYKQFRLEEACGQFSKVLTNDPTHQQALYLSGISYLNLGRYSQACRSLQKLQQHNPNFKSNLYLLLAICHHKLKNHQKAIKFLTIAIDKYENFLEAYCYRAKVLIALKRYNKAEEDYDMALQIDSQKQIALVGKADCLRNSGNYKEAIRYYSIALEKVPVSSILLKRAVLYYQNRMYKQTLKDITQLLQVQQTSEALYYRGLLASEYEKNESDAVLYFQQSIKTDTNPQIATKSAKQLLKIKINACDFYQCTSILSWVGYYHTRQLQPWQNFVQGVICLMKKKYQQGNQQLRNVDRMLGDKDTDYYYLYPLVKLYKGYAEFALHKYQEAYNSYVKYDEFNQTVLGRQSDDARIKYNKLLCEALMLCESDFCEESLQKLKQLIEMDVAKTEPYFYQCMVLLKVAFSDLPITNDHQSKDQIILAVLQIIQDNIHLQANPSIMFYDGVLKAYFSLFQQSQKSLSKAIQKGEQHLAKYFYWRAYINSMLGNHQQAIMDITVSINIEERPEYLLTRCRLHQLSKKTEEAYQDLQKFIECEPNQIEVSKWAAIILFMNEAYSECQRALSKITYIQDQPQIQQIMKYFNVMEGKFSDAGLQGQLIQQVLSGTDTVGLDKLILTNSSYGYLQPKYLYMLRIIKNYANKKYTAAIKDLQYLMFMLKESQDEGFIQIKYNIMVCHLLNGDPQKAVPLFKGLQRIEQRLFQLNTALNQNKSVEFSDLGQFFKKKQLSTYIQPHLIPDSKVRIKLSMPFPQFPDPSIQLRVSEQMITSQITLEAVEGKAEAPWIRRTVNASTVQFTNNIQNIDISLPTSVLVSKKTSGKV